MCESRIWRNFMLNRRGLFDQILYYAWFPLMAAHSFTRNLRSSHFHMQSHRLSQPPTLFEHCCGFPIYGKIVRGNRCTRFDLKACVQSPKDNYSNGSLGINAKGPTFVRRPQLLNNIEIDLVDGIDRRYSTTVQGEPQWGNPLTFHDLSSRDKLVVAVDVDEGMCFHLPFLFFSSLDFLFCFSDSLHFNDASSSSSSSIYKCFGVTWQSQGNPIEIL